VKAKNYSEALTYHLQWKVQFKKFLDGETDIDVAELSLNSCKLGEWLRSDGIFKYASRTEIRQIEKVHAKFHERAKRVYGLKMLDKDFEARRALEKMEATSMQLASLLATLKAINGN